MSSFKIYAALLIVSTLGLSSVEGQSDEDRLVLTDRWCFCIRKSPGNFSGCKKDVLVELRDQVDSAIVQAFVDAAAKNDTICNIPTVKPTTTSSPTTIEPLKISSAAGGIGLVSIGVGVVLALVIFISVVVWFVWSRTRKNSIQINSEVGEPIQIQSRTTDVTRV